MGAEGRGLGLYTALPTALPLSREAATLPRDRQTEAPTKANAKEETPNIRECAPGPLRPASHSCWPNAVPLAFIFKTS